MPSLSERLIDLKEYALKLKAFANVYVIQDSGIKGFVAFYSNDVRYQYAYLAQIAINPNAQNLGLGTILLNKCIAKSKECDMQKLRLEVYKSNAQAIGFYERHGFKLECDMNESLLMYMKL